MGRRPRWQFGAAEPLVMGVCYASRRKGSTAAGRASTTITATSQRGWPVAANVMASAAGQMDM